MPVRSAALVKYVSVAAGGVTVATVPVTDTWILKDARILNNSGVNQTDNLFAQNAAATIFAFIASTTLVAGAFFSWSGWFVLGPGDQLVFNATAAGQSLWVSGTDLPGHV